MNRAKSPQSRNTSISSAYSSQGGLEESLVEELSEPQEPKIKDQIQHTGQVHSFQDIHGNYAKRRYKNVESKVGRYIASIRAEERKRRAAKLVRCSSAPLNVSVPTPVVLVDASSKGQHKGYSTSDLYKLHESTSDYVDTEVMTSFAYSNSTHTAGTSSNGASRHESSDDAVNSGLDFIDKQTYAQLIFEKEHLETLLEEKRTECVRHRRNVDILRIELANCQDELQRTRDYFSGSNLRYNTGFIGYSFAARSNYSRDRLNVPNGVTKTTQTDPLQTLENMGTPKRISVNENFQRLRTNSNLFQQNIGNINRHSYDYSKENDFDCQPAVTASTSPGASEKFATLRSELRYNDHHFAPVMPKKASTTDSIVLDSNSQHSDQARATSPVVNQKSCRRTLSFRERFNRLFGRCVRCDDQSQSTEVYGDPSNDKTIEMEQLDIALK